MLAGKTERMWFATTGRQHLIDPSPIDLNGATITPSSSLHDLGVIVSSETPMTSHVNKVVSECNYKP
jgi:hypothetical protein